MTIALVIALGLLFTGSILLGGASRALPAIELKRRARQKDRAATKIYKLSAYGTSLELFLWLISSLSAAGLLIMAASVSSWLVLVLVLAIGWIFWRGLRTSPNSWLWKIAAAVAPMMSGLVSLLQPLLAPTASWLERRRVLAPDIKIYEKEDLLEFINRQNHHMHNRIPEQELKMAFKALTFGDKLVGSVMVPRRVMKTVAAADSIGPLLMDELHASGFSRFPVVKEATKSANPEIVGILYLYDLIGHDGKGRVRDLMKKKVYFINEAQTLRQALGAFLRTEHHLLIVVNNFEEIVGILTIEDVIEQILGEKIVDEFDQYADMRTVAGLEARKDEDKHPSPEVVE